MKVNQDKIADVIREVAEEKIVPRFRQLALHEIHEKSGPTDLVTIADLEAEIELTRILTDILPGSHVVGEEAVSKGTVLRDVLSTHGGPVWVVDPVDGTNNFASGRPVFGTMVALVQNGERVMSWIYQIPTKRMIGCEKGAGVLSNGKPMPAVKYVSGDADYSSMKAFISRKFIPPHMRPYIDERIKQLKDSSTYMCCAWEYVKILEGDAAFSVYKRIEPWDHLAGVLLLEEAGFFIRKWDGSLYKGSDLSGGLINAPNEELWNRVHKTFIDEPMKQLKLF